MIYSCVPLQGFEYVFLIRIQKVNIRIRSDPEPDPWELNVIGLFFSGDEKRITYVCTFLFAYFLLFDGTGYENLFPSRMHNML